MRQSRRRCTVAMAAPGSGMRQVSALAGSITNGYSSANRSSATPGSRRAGRRRPAWPCSWPRRAQAAHVLAPVPVDAAPGVARHQGRSAPSRSAASLPGTNPPCTSVQHSHRCPAVRSLSLAAASADTPGGLRINSAPAARLRPSNRAGCAGGSVQWPPIVPARATARAARRSRRNVGGCAPFPDG